MSSPPSARKVTAKTLRFYDLGSGEEFEIPAGKPCVVVASYTDASSFGFVNRGDSQAEWAIKTNL